jgi:glutamate/tyrosine decarboxylase-like PLP-dependent enzyme
VDPELVKPSSAHAAFDKACHYLGVKLVEVRVRDDALEGDMQDIGPRRG